MQSSQCDVGVAVMRRVRVQFRSMSSAPSPRRIIADAPESDRVAANWRLWFSGIVVISAVLYFARLGARALWSSEFRWAEISREMIATHNYFWPTINGHVYYDKPLGSYWLVVWSSHLTGGLNELAARIPCAIAGVLGVIFLMLLAQRLYDKRTAIVAGLVLATSFSFVFFSRNASADVETVTGELAALLLFIANEKNPRGWWVIGLWLVMALTSLTKGLLGFVLPIMVIGLYCLLSDGWAVLRDTVLFGPIAARIKWIIERNRWLFNWRSIIAIALAFALYSFPFAFSKAIEGSDKGLWMVWRENVVRFFHPFDHRGPVYLYVYVIFAIMAPWAVLLPAALFEAHRRRRAKMAPAHSDRFALIFFWATFIFFTASGSRRSYYILPILPAGAILVARLLVGGELRSRWAKRLLAIGYSITAVVTIAAVVVMLPPSIVLPGKLALLPYAPDRTVFALLWAVSVASVVYALVRYRPERVAVSMGIIAFCMMLYMYVFAMPAADAYRSEKPFALNTVALLHGDMSHLAFYKTEGPLFYLNPPDTLPEFDRQADLTRAINQDGIRWFIVKRRDIPNLALETRTILMETTFPWEGAEQRRNKILLVEVNPTSASAKR